MFANTTRMPVCEILSALLLSAFFVMGCGPGDMPDAASEGETSQHGPILVIEHLTSGGRTSVPVVIDTPLPSLVTAAQALSRMAKLEHEIVEDVPVGVAVVSMRLGGKLDPAGDFSLGQAELSMTYEMEMLRYTLFRVAENRFAWARGDDADVLNDKAHSGWFNSVAEATDWLGIWYAQVFTFLRGVEMAWHGSASPEDAIEEERRLRGTQDQRGEALFQQLREHRERHRGNIDVEASASY